MGLSAMVEPDCAPARQYQLRHGMTRERFGQEFTQFEQILKHFMADGAYLLAEGLELKNRKKWRGRIFDKLPFFSN